MFTRHQTLRLNMKPSWNLHTTSKYINQIAKNIGSIALPPCLATIFPLPTLPSSMFQYDTYPTNELASVKWAHSSLNHLNLTIPKEQKSPQHSWTFYTRAVSPYARFEVPLLKMWRGLAFELAHWGTIKPKPGMHTYSLFTFISEKLAFCSRWSHFFLRCLAFHFVNIYTPWRITTWTTRIPEQHQVAWEWG